MTLYKPGSSSNSGLGTTEFEILKSSHKFLREDEPPEGLDVPWEEQLAKKYYSSLYREYAVCNLKHYKSGNFSLRWRTEDEVVAGAGETTCGNTRCPLHSTRTIEELHPSLKTLELPFSYSEDGESKFALVKVVLCDKCCKKLMWKRNQDKLGSEQVGPDSQQSLLRARADPKDLSRIERDGVDVQSSEGKESSTRQERRPFQRGDGDVRRRNSRSQSPKRRGRSP